MFELPDDIWINPPFPTLDVPVLITITPLVPASPEFDVSMRIFPLEN
jgi:hypothetical protein